MKITVEGLLHTEHPNYRPPTDTDELLEALSKWVNCNDFRWKIGDEEWVQGKAHDFANDPEWNAMHKNRSLFDIIFR